jgi:hypothetical protein
MSAFMVPEYYHGDAFSVQDEHGESQVFLADAFSLADVANLSPEWRSIEREHGWYARLTAPGYMDQTDWSGPYETEAEAREYIYETYDVDPDSGEDLPNE